ncbi:MAG: FMN-binding protein [Acidobacteriota bacterium]
MRLYRQMVAVLTGIGLISGALLVAVNLFTKDRIAENKRKEIELAVVRVIPGAAASEKIYEEKDFTVYQGKDDQGNVLGIAVNAAAGGFQDKILYMFGLNADLTKINGLYVLQQKETPGLGAKITSEEAFLQFWEGRDARATLKLRKPAIGKEDLGASEVNTVTGATVSSRAMVSSVNAALEKIKRLREEGKLASGGGNAD